PYRAKSGLISVTTPTGTSNSPVAFTVIGPGPYISDFSPTVGGGGTLVAISGRFFLGVTDVQFNGSHGSGITTNSDTLIQVFAPAGVTTGPITVVTRLGTNTTSSVFYAPPVISSLSVSNGRPGTNVTISGASFLGATAVTFNGINAPFTVVDNAKIQTTVPTNVTTGPIWVYAPAGSAFSSTFKVPPTIAGFSPTFGQVGSSITITGANFTAGNLAVKFNGTQAAAPTGVSATRLTAVVPAGATTGPITVSTTDGSDTTATLFYLPPTISGFSPTNSPPGTTVTITGTSLLGASAVSFNGVPASFVPAVTNTTLVATVPLNVSSGPIRVTAPGGNAVSSGVFYGPPGITSFSPTHGMPNTSVTITGTNLLGTSAVLFNGRSAMISSVANNQVVAIVPGGAQTGPITVVAPAGSTNTTSDFVLDYSIDLQVSVVDAPDPTTVGSNLVYTITLLNNSAYDSPGVSFTNTLSPLVQLKSATTTRGTLATNGNVLTCDLGWVTNHTTVTVTLRVAPQAAGTLTNTATLAGYYPDPNSANNTATTLTRVDPLALLSIYRPSAARVRVSWPAALTNYVLEYKKILATNVYWSNVTTAPIVSGDQQFVTETNSEAAKFYRLRK
ncbi:MAG TPA: IPT/TIG domain-containing protein, partial [Candidatus Sulfotelmatobacter sp.]|nr:IPT/TIG domain-containing protein [Candidatus Sulfotelmatobacter sp.]